jgi:hypothetical protein
MKKVLLIGALLAGGYFMLRKKDDTIAALPNQTNTPAVEPTFFQKYNGKIVVDSDGNYMLVLNGKIYTFAGVKELSDYTMQNPQHKDSVAVDFPAWKQYANLPGIYGGNYNPFVKA